VRLNFLPELVHEAFEFVHRRLTASSMLGVKLFWYPFHRDVEVSTERARAMLEQINFCRRVRGVAFITPEARCSLHLKQHELGSAKRNEERELLWKFENQPYVDPFLEHSPLADDILHPFFTNDVLYGKRGWI